MTFVDFDLFYKGIARKTIKVIKERCVSFMTNIKDSRTIYIWGAGSSGKRAFEKFKNQINIMGFIDSDSQKWGGKIFNKKIFTPTKAKLVPTIRSN